MDATKIKDWEDEILDYERNRHNDAHHRNKRIYSFQWFDEILEGCQNGKCPQLLEPTKLYAFIDISIEGYINKKAYYFSEKKDSETDKERYINAEKMIKRVLNCKNIPNLSEEIFNIDSKEVMDNRYHETQFAWARKRKVYWTHLDFHSWQCDEEYYEAHNFINEIHTIAQKPLCCQRDVDQVRKLLVEKRHIANALDLYRLCIVRAKCKA